MSLLTRSDIPLVVGIFAVLVIATTVYEHAEAPRTRGEVASAILSVIASQEGGPFHPAPSSDPYRQLPIGKEAGVEQGRARLRALQEFAPTPDAFFPIFARNYLIACYIDERTEVEIDDDHGVDSPRRTMMTNLDAPMPSVGSRVEPVEQRFVQWRDVSVVIRLHMLEYLPVAGGFVANVGVKRLSDDPAFVPGDRGQLRFAPWEADDRRQCGSSSGSGEGGVVDRKVWDQPLKLRHVGAFALRGFVFPDRQLRRVARGGFIASEPVILRVFRADDPRGGGK
jgi:hypothetical protein